MKYVLAALVVASIAVFSVSVQAATPSPAGSEASASQASQLRAVKSALRKDVKRSLRRVRKLDLSRIEAKGFAVKRLRALVAGKASVSATTRSATTASSAAKRVTVAKGSRKFAGKGRSTVRLKLSRSGKRLLKQTSLVTLTVKAVFKLRSGGRVSVRFKVKLKRKPGPGTGQGPGGGSPGTAEPPVPSGPIPANAQLQYLQTFETPTWSGLSQQCQQPAKHGTDAGDGYARLEVRAADAPLYGNERCELSYGGYDQTLPPGSYWYRVKMRTGVGFPQAPGAANWVTLQQWQEDRPPAGTPSDAVDGALFVNSGPNERMYIRGEQLNISQSNVFEINDWHEFVVHGVFTDDPAQGYLEWWIDNVKVGRTNNGATAEYGGRHFWKGGITRADVIDTLQQVDIANVEIWKD